MKRSEKKEYFIKLAKLIEKSGICFSNALQNTNVTENLEEIYSLESQGDQIQTILDKDFASQKNIPYLAIDRAKLLRRMDSVLDEFKSSVKEFEIYRVGLPKEFYLDIKILGENIISMSKMFADGIEIMYSDFALALRKVSEIEELHDEMRDNIFQVKKKYYNKLKETDNWSTYIAISSSIERILSVIRLIKAASEIIGLMAYKYM